MDHTKIVTAAELESYADTRESEAVIPELMYMLINASPGITECRIPYGDKVNQPGLDGRVESENGFNQFVPKKSSVWEIGTGRDPQDKATDDFKKRTAAVSVEIRAATAFVFVTPRSSGSGGWTEPSHGGCAKTLERRLATNPAFFCEVIRAIFRTENDDGKGAEPTEQQRAIASNAYHLLHDWRTAPGVTNDNSFDTAAFWNWLQEVKKSTAESGHLRIAMSQVGQALVHAPKDAEDIWINPVAEALNAKDAAEMRSGFTCRLANLRGVHGFSAGKEEREIATGYRKKAEAIERRGYSRFATAMRELAESYERDAEREAARNPYGE